MSEITVLHVIEHLRVGGEEAMVSRLASRLNHGVIRPMVATFLGGSLEQSLRERRVPVYQVETRLKMGRILALARLIRKMKVDVVHTHLFSAGLWGRLAGLVAGRPALVHTHGTLTFHARRAKRLPMELLLARFTDRTICVSEAVREHITAALGGAGRTVTIPNAIDTQEFACARRKLHSPPRVAAIGRLDPVKGYDILIRALALLKAEGLDVHCTIAGEGPQRGELETLARKMGLVERVEFAGKLDRVLPLLESADLLAAPSWREGLSLTLLEAMAAAMPIVATPVGGNRELIEGVGWLVPTGDSWALARAIAERVTNPEESLEGGRRARLRAVESYDIERMIESHQRLYQEVTGMKS